MIGYNLYDFYYLAEEDDPNSVFIWLGSDDDGNSSIPITQKEFLKRANPEKMNLAFESKSKSVYKHLKKVVLKLTKRHGGIGVFGDKRVRIDDISLSNPTLAFTKVLITFRFDSY